METLTLAGRTVSRIALGTWAIGASEWSNVDRDASVATVLRALSLGINLVDTAPIYGAGNAEDMLGEALARHIAAGGKREDIFIATKFGLQRRPDRRVVTNATPAFLAEELDNSLRRLRTDFIDLYQLHWPDPLVPMEQVAEALLPHLATGRVRALGLSNCSPAQMQAFQSVAPLASNQPPYNLFERGIEADVLPYTDSLGIASLAWSALCRSLLAGRVTAQSTFTDIRQYDPKFQPPRLAQYAAAAAALDQFAQSHYNRRVLHLAIRWLLDRSPHIVALWGAHRPAHLDDVAACLGWHLDASAMQAIDDILATHITDPVGPEYLTPGIRTE